MKQLKKNDAAETLLKKNLIRVGDVINMEGPMLTLFKDIRNQNLYLFDWVDGDDISNRWLIYDVLRTTLFDFLHLKISYKEMFDVSVKECYVADIVSAKVPDYSIYKIQSLPQEYRPDKDIFFDRKDAVDLDQINNQLVVSRSIHINDASEKLNNMYEISHIYGSYRGKNTGPFHMTSLSGAINVLSKYPKNIKNLNYRSHSQKDDRKNNRLSQSSKVGLQ